MEIFFIIILLILLLVIYFLNQKIKEVQRDLEFESNLREYMDTQIFDLINKKSKENKK